jgi:hypothetical protein
MEKSTMDHASDRVAEIEDVESLGSFQGNCICMEQWNCDLHRDLPSGIDTVRFTVDLDEFLPEHFDAIEPSAECFVHALIWKVIATTIHNYYGMSCMFDSQGPLIYTMLSPLRDASIFRKLHVEEIEIKSQKTIAGVSYEFELLDFQDLNYRWPILAEQLTMTCLPELDYETMKLGYYKLMNNYNKNVIHSILTTDDHCEWVFLSATKEVIDCVYENIKILRIEIPEIGSERIEFL